MNLGKMAVLVTAVAATVAAASAAGVSLVRSETARAAPKASRISKDISCVPVQVVVFTTAPRMHVRCASAVGGIVYFAQSTSNSSLAARVLSLLTTAQVAGRTLVIRYDPADTSGAAIGCLISDCRLIQAVGFGR
jgi:hypothetical protein